MTTNHIFFIPVMLLLGAIGGWVQGRKMLLAEQAEARAAEERKAARKAALHAEHDKDPVVHES